MSLCTLNDVKEQIDQTTYSSGQEAFLSVTIDTMSSIFETYCHRTFESATYTEYYDAIGTDIIRPNQYPITSVTSIHYDPSWEWDTSSLITSGYYMIHNNNRDIVLDHQLAEARQAIKIVYTAGYSTIPSDLKQACINEVIKRYLNRYRSKNVDVVNRSDTEGSNISYNNNDLMSETKLILKEYKNRPRLI